MKPRDFRPEHFPNGQSFSRADFDAYGRASEALTRTVYTRYLPFVGGGIVLCVLLSNLAGGVAGNLLGVVCIFAGLIAGGVCNVRASRAVNEAAARLGVTRQDVAAARKHVKNGTVAWSVTDAAVSAEGGFCPACGQRLRQGAVFCSGCGAPTRQAPASATAAEPAPVADAAPLKIVERPMRAVWASALLVLGWLLLVLLQSAFGPQLRFCADGLYLLMDAMLGAAVYLVSVPRLKYRLWGGGVGLAAAVVRAFTVAVCQQPGTYSDKLSVGKLLTPQYVNIGRLFTQSLLVIGLMLGAALLVSLLCKKLRGKARTRAAAGAASGVFLAGILVLAFFRFRPAFTVISMGLESVVISLISALADAACVLLMCMAVRALCCMVSSKVKLHGVGLVWVWIATLGAAAGTVLALVAGMVDSPLTGSYTAGLLLGVCSLLGYILLLCKRRAGLYYILIGAGLMLAAQALTVLSGAIFVGGKYLTQLLSFLVAGVNPLFAWLAVRAGTPSARDCAN